MKSIDLRYARQRLDAGSSRERAWLVGIASATPSEVAEALPPSEAVGWARFGGQDVPQSVVTALRDGRALLLLSSLGAATSIDQSGPAAVDLADLIEDAADLVADVVDDGPEPTPPPVSLHEVEVLVVNVLGEPQAAVAYTLRLPDGSMLTGRTGPDGTLRHPGLTHTGTCELDFPELGSLGPESTGPESTGVPGTLTA